MPSIHRRSRSSLLLPLVLPAILAACGEAPPPAVETVRAIRTITVAEPASGNLRRFSGVVEAASTSGLSFEVPGNVQEVAVEVGERVAQGQLLARLDTSDFQLNLEAAQANSRRAEVELQDARRELERLQRVADRDRGFVSEQMLDQARAAYDAARQSLSYTNTRLNLARRDLDRTQLQAPFDGVVTERNVDPFQEIDRGQRLFVLQAEGAMEAVISVPESEIKRVYLGLRGEIRLPALQGRQFSGLVTEISESAGSANAFPVKLTIQAEGERIRPGLTAEVSLLLGGDDGAAAYLVPLSALVPRGEATDSQVFVFDRATSKVVKTPITHGGISGDNLVVEQGLQAGDILAVAGVSFLRDGQPVRLMGE
jgi:RND family efflux transporter MFP subunit